LPHVLNHVYDKVMIITICNMQSENIDAQCVMWRKLNKVMMAKHRVFSPYFKGFMVNSAQVNWNVMHIVYESNDLYVQLQDKERICSFH
jgi:hypothetical protein